MNWSCSSLVKNTSVSCHHISSHYLQNIHHNLHSHNYSEKEALFVVLPDFLDFLDLLGLLELPDYPGFYALFA
jgi:hypothetical protein